MVKVLQTKRVTGLLILCVVLLFVLSAVYRVSFLPAELSELLTGTDDWNRYAVYGFDIKNNGWSIPSEQGPYQGPGGFLYNYYIAFCILLFGDNAYPVYIGQSIMLALSVIFIYLAFRKKMSARTGFLFLVALIAFAFVDVFKYYTFQLLSENLGMFLISAAVLFVIRAEEKNKFSLRWVAASLFALAVATRPNLFPIAVLFVVLILFYYLKYKRSEWWQGGVIILTILAGISLLAIRNYVRTGQFVFLPTLGIADTAYQTEEFSANFLWRKLLYCFGDLPALDDRYQIRPHWMFMWLGYVVYWISSIRSGIQLHRSEWLIHLFLFLYYLLTLLFVYVISYGFRVFIPVTFILLAFAFIGYERWYKSLFKGVYLK